MNAEKLNKWADLLLDTGKRNNLINFKDAAASSVEILSPDVATLFNKAEHATVFEVYDPKLEDEEEFVLEEAELLKTEKRISKKDYFKAYAGKLKRQQILAYNIGNKPLTALKNISKKAKSAIEETGVNIAYMAFGFISWMEENAPNAVMNAPILLAPITIENESSVDPYRIRVTGDEIIVNPTFAFKLLVEYGIKLPDFDEDEGIEGYFAKIDGMVSKLKWHVSPECKIGIFSFLKINMYKDLKDNAKKIVKHVGVRALLGDKSVRTDVGGSPSETDLLDLHNVVDADSSQAEAIEMALRGESFVLQGPPGTGKSQTITNIIAECLLNEKKVLFVSEKLAALSVVYDKLKNVGLEEFCLELHSHKANKKQVIDELCHTLKLSKSGISDQAEKELQAKKEAQKQLDKYTDELHKPRPIIGKTLYQLYEELSSCRRAPDAEFVVKDVKKKGAEYIDQAEAALQKYVDYVPSIGYDYRTNTWYGYKNTDCSYQSVMQVKTDLASVADLCQNLQTIGVSVSEKYNLTINTLEKANVFGEFFALIQGSGFIAPPLLHASKLQKTLEAVEKMQVLAGEIFEKKGILDKDFDEELYKLDGPSTYKKLTRQFGGFFSRLFGGEYKRMVTEIRLCKKDGKRPNYKTAVSVMETLASYQQKVKEFNDLHYSVENSLGGEYVGIGTDFERCLTELRALAGIHSTGLTFGKLPSMRLEEFITEQSAFAFLAGIYTKAFAEQGEAVNRLADSFEKGEYDVLGVTLSNLKERLETCHKSIGELDNWCKFVALLDQLQGLELRSFVDYSIQNNIQPSQLISVYKKAFYTQWVDYVLHDSPVLLELARVPHDEAVKRFRAKDELHFEINKAKIKANLSSHRPNLDMVAQGSSISILLREGEKKRKQKGIRTLLSEIGELAQTLKPCFLMSPLSVSTYLGSDMKFDVVIFDEASQIFPQDAVGAIYRGKQLIVVGDSMQMPPSNFFSSTADADAEDESEDLTDFESILDLCATAFPQRRLKWHYRSRFEQLISFSNQHFYDDDLVTFPSSKTDKLGIGVDFVHVDGVFDRKTKTNRAEAEKIVDMVFEHIENYPDRSLGVVAFSVAQQSLIDHLIYKRRRQDPTKDDFFKSDKLEPFFVKNLETVQGDERDTIIFSIAYARDAQGKFLANFGPVNREGGERRLNVAVTRAKQNVKVVASMHAGEMDLSGTKSVGAKLLRDYLDYAENGAITTRKAGAAGLFEKQSVEIETEVAEFLKKHGYVVDMQVGCSSFKIDLAVRRSGNADYVMAIECDGPAYRLSKTTRDRDRLQQDVLERMGWKFYRIWSTDWFRNKRVEQERLLSALKEAFDTAPRKGRAAKEGKPAEVTFAKAVQEQRFAFPKYEQVDELSIAKGLGYDVVRVTRAILETEAPLAEEWLLKRIVFLFGGREKVTNVVRNEFNRVMWNSGNHGILRRDEFLYLQGKEIPMLRVPESGETPRDVKYIAVEELANGLRELLKRNVTVEKAGLFKLLAEQLGFTRMGEAMSVRFEQALKLLSAEYEADGDTLTWNEA